MNSFTRFGDTFYIEIDANFHDRFAIRFDVGACATTGKAWLKFDLIIFQFNILIAPIN